MGRGRAGTALTLLAAAAGLAALTERAEAQGTVHAALFSAELTAAEARLEVRFELRGILPGDSVSVSLLDFGEAVATGVRAGGGGAPVEIRRSAGAARAARLPVEAGPDGQPALVVAYSVPVPTGGGGSVVAHLPVVTVDLPPEEARPGLFQGRIALPPEWSLREGFPTAMVRSGADPGSWRVELQVVPSVVTVRAATDGRRTPGLPLLLDVVAVAGLVLFSLLGWRHLAAGSA